MKSILALVAVTSLTLASGCVTQEQYQAQLDQSQQRIHQLEQENVQLQADLHGHQSLSCRIITAVEDTTASVYDVTKPVVVSGAEKAVGWVEQKYQEHQQGK